MNVTSGTLVSENRRFPYGIYSLLRKKEEMYWPMCCEQASNCRLFLNAASPEAISSFFPFAMIPESWISSRTALQAAPDGVSSLTKSEDSAEKKGSREGFNRLMIRGLENTL
jgi:hypothetical protein